MTTYVTYGIDYLKKRLREHRYRIGLAADYVAKAIGVSVADLECYEYGQKPITKEALLKLATLYQVSPDYFLGGDPLC